MIHVILMKIKRTEVKDKTSDLQKLADAGPPHKFYVMLGSDNAIQCFDSQVKALKYFEDSYRRSTQRGQVAASLIHSATFNPSAVTLASFEELLAQIDFENENDATSAQAYTVSCDAGSERMVLLKLTAESLWQEGEKPGLG